ncbi:MAG: SPASM domain-containing protein [Eubacterium sp.]|nr:SPASM domain-containing protein [Eubacterium sp.]MCM1411304.1 SPASM domain-containing protein [Lachnospiraceae bacterium]
MTILPTGDVYACRRMESKIGNVFDTSMYDILMSAMEVLLWIHKPV